MSILERRQESRKRLEGPPMTPADFLVVHVTGYHFCESCQRITNLTAVDSPWPKCEHCRSYKVTWHPPIPTDAPPPT
jgi:hypothetical protein